MALHTWHNLSADGNVRGLKYSFGFGTANTMAAKLEDGRWLVVSPAANIAPDLLDALGGDVAALVAPNGFHHMGQAAWRARFPAATSYAPAASIPRLASKAKGIPFLPIADLTAKLPASLALFEPAGMKSPDLFVRATAGADTVWFTGDLLSNTTSEDLSAVPRFVFSLFGGNAGYKLNKVPAMVYLKDRAAFVASVRTAIEAAPATVVYPAHGDAVTDDVMPRTRTILA